MRPVGSITVSEDPSVRTGGFALVRVAGAAGRGQGVGLYIRRLGHQDNNLGAEGWQGPESLWTPLGVADEGGDLVLRLGPEIVDRIGVGEAIELELPRLGIRGELVWPEITPSTNSRAGRTDTPVSQQQPYTPPPPPPPPPPVADPDPILEVGVPPADAGRPRRTWPWVLLALAAVLAGLVAGAFAFRCDLGIGFLYPGNEACGVAPAPVALPEPAPPPEPDADRIDRLDLPCPADIDVFTCVRQLQALPEAERFEIAMRALDLGDLDIAIVVLRRLATDGHGPALREIGRMYDPAYYGPETSVFSRPDAVNARRYYGRAVEAGDAAAQALLDALP